MAQKSKTPDATQCVIYARYSSLAQRDQSIEDQVAACERWAASHGLSVYDVYADRHISGTTDSRPAFQQMIKDASQGAWATVVVYKVDRFARDKADAAIYRRKLRELGVSVESAMEAIPDGPEGIILEGMLDAFAEYYSRNLSQNVRRGMMSNAEKCMTNGVEVLGYKTAQDGTYEIDESTAPIVREMFSRRAAGETVESLAQWMGSVGVRTKFDKRPSICFTRKRLADPRYRGIYRFADIEVPGGMPRIVDDETWHSAQAQPYRKYSTIEQRLHGRVFDLETGQPFTCEYAKNHAGKIYHYYTIKPKGEKRWRISAPQLEGAVVDAIKTALEEPRLAHQIAVDAVALAREEAESPTVQSARKRISEIHKETARLVDSIAAGVPADIIQPKLHDLSEELQDCEKIVAGISDAIPSVEEVVYIVKHRFVDWELRYDDLCSIVTNTYIDKCGGYVICELAWGKTSASRLPKKQQTRRQAAGSKNSHWLTFGTGVRTYEALTRCGDMIIRIKASWLE